MVKFLAALLVWLAIASGAAAWPGRGHATQILTRTKTNYSTSGPYLAYQSSYGTGTWTENNQFRNAMYTTAALFPNDTIFAWSFPNWVSSSLPCSGVCSFNFISFCDYYGVTVPAPCTPRQVKNITTLSTTFLDFYGAGGAIATNGYDAADDYYLTEGSGTGTVHDYEVIVYYHLNPQAVAFCALGTAVGTTTISGTSWNVRFISASNPPTYTLGVFTVCAAGAADVGGVGRSITIDHLALLNFIKNNGYSGVADLYVNGIGHGCEIYYGGGSCWFKEFSGVFN